MPLMPEAEALLARSRSLLRPASLVQFLAADNVIMDLVLDSLHNWMIEYGFMPDDGEDEYRRLLRKSRDGFVAALDMRLDAKSSV